MLATHRGNTDHSSVDGAATTDLFTKLGQIFKKVEFLYHQHPLIFSPLKMINVDPHARGFAPLQPVAQGSTCAKVHIFGAKNDEILKIWIIL